MKWLTVQLKGAKTKRIASGCALLIIIACTIPEAFEQKSLSGYVVTRAAFAQLNRATDRQEATECVSPTMTDGNMEIAEKDCLDRSEFTPVSLLKDKNALLVGAKSLAVYGNTAKCITIDGLNMEITADPTRKNLPTGKGDGLTLMGMFTFQIKQPADAWSTGLSWSGQLAVRCFPQSRSIIKTECVPITGSKILSFGLASISKAPALRTLSNGRET